MKSKFIIITTFVILLCLQNKSFANKYDIDAFDGSGTSNEALIKRATPFVSDDLANFVSDITATSNIDTNMPSTTLTLDGNNYTLSGASGEGTYLTNGSNYTIKNLNVNGFSGISHTDASTYKSTGWMPEVNNAFKSLKPEIFTNSPMQAAYDAVAPDKTKWR